MIVSLRTLTSAPRAIVDTSSCNSSFDTYTSESTNVERGYLFFRSVAVVAELRPEYSKARGCAVTTHTANDTTATETLINRPAIIRSPADRASKYRRDSFRAATRFGRRRRWGQRH